jgi:hypothetical protein
MIINFFEELFDGFLGGIVSLIVDGVMGFINLLVYGPTLP